jgi:hypothetical protein
MSKIKFINPLFDTNYFKELFLTKINPVLETDLGDVINNMIVINLYNRVQGVHETQSTSNFEWTPQYSFMNETVYTAVSHVNEVGKIMPGPGNKSIQILSIDLMDTAHKEKYYDICINRNFMYLWFSVHKGPHELPTHVDGNSPIRYVQCIFKNSVHNDWWYNGNNLILNEGDAFIFDPKFPHNIITKKTCESIFLIADCPEYTIDEFLSNSFTN